MSAWRTVAEIITRPQPVTVPMVTLFALIPFYLVVGYGVILLVFGMLYALGIDP